LPENGSNAFAFQEVLHISYYNEDFKFVINNLVILINLYH